MIRSPLGSRVDAMASSLSSCFAPCKCKKPSVSRKIRVSGGVRAQSSEEYGGKSTNIVDSNMKVLRKRIEELQKQEKLRRCRGREAGWYYPSGYDVNLKRKRRASETAEIAFLMARTFGLTLFAGTLGLCLVSLLVHYLNR